MHRFKDSVEEQDFELFLKNLKENDERAWLRLDFVLKRILFKWLARKEIYSTDAQEIYCNCVAVFIAKMNKLHFENFSALKSYVFSIADNKAKEFYRDNLKRKKTDTLEKINESDYLILLNEFEKEEIQEKITRIYSLFDSLTKLEKKVMILLYKEEKSSKETAELLGLKSGNLRVIKHRAIEKMKKGMSNINN